MNQYIIVYWRLSLQHFNNQGGFIINKARTNAILVFILVLSSIMIYSIQYLAFHRAEETVFYLLQDLAFVPMQVAVVTIIINRFLNMMEERKKIKKINVIISAFFVDAGTTIIKAMSDFNRNHKGFCEMLEVNEFGRDKSSIIKKLVREFKHDLYADPGKLEKLAGILDEKKAYMLGMLENSNLIEHDSFTDMIWSVFHVADELQSRESLTNIPQEDIEHLSNDLLRAYSALIREWINYIFYLKNEYPFLYSLAIRKNPFTY